MTVIIHHLISAVVKQDEPASMVPVVEAVCAANNILEFSYLIVYIYFQFEIWIVM